MVIRETIDVDAPPMAVWAVLGNPNLMEHWNPKCVSAASLDVEMHKGLTFHATFAMNAGHEKPTTIEVLDAVPRKKLVLRHVVEDMKPGECVVETFTMKEIASGTAVRHEVDISKSGLPFLVLLLAKVISVIGRKVGDGSLDAIKELAEDAS